MPFLFLLKKKFLKYKHLLESNKLVFLFTFLIISFMIYVYYGTGRTVVDTLYYTTMIMTTIGFGDITPQSDIEKLVIVGFMGVGITSVGYLFGSVSNKVTVLSNMKRKGLKSMKKEVGLLIIGYPSEQKVREIVEHVRNDDREQENIVCLNNILNERPQWMEKENITFIKGIGSDKEALMKANVLTADTCLILANKTDDYASDDYSSSAATVFLKLKKESAKLLVEVVRSDNMLFEDYDDEIVTTFRVDNAEVISQEILDPGAFQLKSATFSTKTLGTQYNMDIVFQKDTQWSEIAYTLIMAGAVPEGFKLNKNNNFNLLPSPDEVLSAYDTYNIKYRAAERINVTEILSSFIENPETIEKDTNYNGHIAQKLTLDKQRHA